MPDILLIEADHDMRNPADFLVLNKLAKAVFAVPGISDVQAITRPEGTPIEHTSIPFMLSMQNASQVLYSAVSERPHERHAQAGRRDDDNDQSNAAHVRLDATDGRHDSSNGRPNA